MASSLSSSASSLLWRTALVLLSTVAMRAPGLSWQENLRPRLFCAMTDRDYAAFVGNTSAEDRFTGLLYTDFTADGGGMAAGQSDAYYSTGGPSINTPYSTTPPSLSAAAAPEEEDPSSGGLLLIGAKNMVYKLSASELRLTQTLHWPADETARETCVVKGKSREACQNYVKVMQQYSSDPTRFLFCGTNAFTPTCRDYADERASFVRRSEHRGVGMAPFDPEHNSTAVLVGDDLYAGTVADFAGVDSIVFRRPLRTQQYDSTQLNSPDFVGSFSHENFVYFFFREAAVEYINCGKSVFSRVARVCKNDQGGPHKSKHSWTSFLKARLNCSVPGEYPFYFDEIQGVSHLVRGNYGDQKSRSSREDILYATFSTPANSIGGSAVCAFRLRDVADAFSGRFKEQRSMSANWLPVEPHKVPLPRPGTCINDTKSLPDPNLNFIKTHSLMDETVPPFFGAPVVIRTGLVSRFTALAVDAQVRTTSGDAYDVIFVGTTNGRVMKALNSKAGRTHHGVQTVIVEELQVFPADVIVKDLKVMGGGREGRRSLAQLAAMSSGEVRSFPVQRCDRASTCAECVALQDPYCAWEIRSARCSSGDWTKNMASSFLQSVDEGFHQRCPGGAKLKEEMIGESQGYSYVQKFEDYRLGQVVNIVDERVMGRDDTGKSGSSSSSAAGGGGGPGVKVLEPSQQHFSLEMLLITVSAGAVAALVVGFVTGYCCGRKCRKDDGGHVGGLHLPYPDTEYEYFEQRGGLARPPGAGGPQGGLLIGGGGQTLMMGGGVGPGAPLLPAQSAKLDGRHEEVTYAEPELITGAGLRPLPPTGGLLQQQPHQGPPPPIRFPGPPSSGGNSTGRGGGGGNSHNNSLDGGGVGAPHYSSSLLNPANKFNTIHHSAANKRPLPSINHYESAAEARLGSGKDPAYYARGRDNFNSYHMSTLGRGSGSNASGSRAAAMKDPLLGDRGPGMARGGSGLEQARSEMMAAGAGSSAGSSDSSCGGGVGAGGDGGGGGGKKGQQVVDSAYGTTTRSVKKVYL